MGPGGDRPGFPDGPGAGRGWHGDPGWHNGHGWHDGHGWHGRGGHGPWWDGPGFAGGPWWDWWPLLPTLAFALFMLGSMVLLSRRGSILLNRVPLLSPPPPALDPASEWRARWHEAVQRHRATARAYADYECDVRAVLARPALADVTQPATARFVDAFAEAVALCTDRYPGPAYAQRFIASAEYAERAWAAAVDAAERIRDARFAPGERRLVEQVTTLLDLALSSPYEAERRSAYQRATRRLVELERRTGWRLPRPAAAELEHRARPQLAAAG